MTTYAGSALIVQWLHSGGTTELTGDHKTFTYTPSITFINARAGADKNESYIPSAKDGSATFNANMQAGSGAGGTAAFSTCEEGALGTLKWYPEGTAIGKPYKQIPAYSQGVADSSPYNDVTEVTINFQQNGARVEDTVS